MKTLLMIIVSACFGLAVAAQTGTVTINVKGTRNTQVAVDNQYYEVANTSNSTQKTITLRSLSNGSHALEIVRRNNNYSAATNSINTSFTVRSGYNLTINIAANGSITQSETRIGAAKAVTTTVYNRIYSQTRSRTSSSARATYLEDQFSNTNRMFTSSQLSRLIQLVNSEEQRFELAKQSYLLATDPENFSNVSSLLNSTSNRNALQEYINSTGATDTGNDDTGSPYSPMSDSRFQVIYNELMSQSGNSNKNYYLSNFFAKDFNYYSSAQARRLIQMINTEAERLYLAKLAYRGITDQDSYYSNVASLLGSTSSRSDLATYINSYTTSTIGSPMSFSTFNTIYQAAYNQSTTSGRYNSIYSALTTSGNVFSVAQEKQLLQLISDQNSRLQLAKAGYTALADRTNALDLSDLFTSSVLRNEWSNYVNGYGTGATGTAMSDASFSSLYNNVNSNWNTSTRFSLVAGAFSNNRNYFSSYQVRQLLQLISSESDRLTLAKSAYDNVVDPANFNQVYNLFSSSSNRYELERYVSASGGGGIVVRTAMSDDEYRTIYRDVQYTFGLGAKMSELTKIFNNESYYFTVEQAKQLIRLVSSESNRLELAKSSYNNITDPANFSNIYDIFSSQSSKDELSSYVNNYR